MIKYRTQREKIEAFELLGKIGKALGVKAARK